MLKIIDEYGVTVRLQKLLSRFEPRQNPLFFNYAKLSIHLWQGGAVLKRSFFERTQLPIKVHIEA